MISTPPEVFHLGLRKSMLEGVKVALLPGDPQRVGKIAKYLKNTRELAHAREFVSVRGEYKGQSLMVCSTGIGGPSAAIAVEELALLGVRNFLRIGTTGALQPNIKACDVVIPTGAVRFDGASKHLAPIEYPAVADFDLVSAVRDAARNMNARHHLGVCASSDTFYQGQNRKESFQQGFFISDLKHRIDDLMAMNVLSLEMETATIFTQAASYGLKAACVLGVLLNRHHEEFPDPALAKQTEQIVIQVALEAAANFCLSDQGVTP